MAQMLELNCTQCGEQEIQLDGPILSGARPRCEQCGDSRLVPWGGPAGSETRPGLSHEALQQLTADSAGTCSCGGRFSFTAPLRCSVCRSTDIRTTDLGIAD